MHNIQSLSNRSRGYLILRVSERSEHCSRALRSSEISNLLFSLFVNIVSIRSNIKNRGLEAIVPKFLGLFAQSLMLQTKTVASTIRQIDIVASD